MGFKSTFVKKSLLLIFVIAFFAAYLIEPSYAAPSLNCKIRTNCPSSNPITVFKMDSISNSHAGINVSAYTQRVCCGVTSGGDLSVMNYSYDERGECTSPIMGRVISISGNVNAHVAEYGIGFGYQNNICLSSSNGNITCQYQSGGGESCNNGYECLASITGDTNAHVGECGQHDIKVCCKLIEGSLPPSIMGDLEMGVGETGMFVFNITNDYPDPDMYTMELSGTPSKIGYWAWFNGHRYDGEKNNVSVTLGPGETASFAVIVFGGEAGVNGEVNVIIKSALTGKTTQLSRSVEINYKNDGIFTDVPEFGWMGYLLIGVIAAVIFLL